MNVKKYTTAIERLRQCGVKPSMQRVVIMDYMLAHRTHPTADEIFNELNAEMPTLSRTTVYNTLKLLAQQGAIMELDIDRNNLRYDGYTAQHAHFKCKHCGKIYDLPLQTSPVAPTQTPENFLIEEEQTYYKGRCKQCRE
jgi:Fur family ferric uptake transcriptional regulator/Fur family peroxide stress response transcriptional regulator